MSWQARSELPGPPQRVSLGHALRLYLGLAALGLTCLATSAGMLAGALLMPRGRHQRHARSLTSLMFRKYLGAMQRLGALRLDVSALDALTDAPAMVIAPNHPSMIDAGLVLSRLTNLTCIMKSEILHSVMFGASARMSGYIANEPPRAMLRTAVDNLKAGFHLLLFPEGTRTEHLPVNSLQRTVAVIARRAGVPVQTVLIETSSPFLCKGWPLLRVPAMPMEYRLRLGERFDPPADVDLFTAQLENYFQSELAHARLPALPGEPPRTESPVA
jgi:1-acyl-sn-glycerol-3-phosphate acyltransferase